MLMGRRKKTTDDVEFRFNVRSSQSNLIQFLRNQRNLDFSMELIIRYYLETTRSSGDLIEKTMTEDTVQVLLDKLEFGCSAYSAPTETNGPVVQKNENRPIETEKNAPARPARKQQVTAEEMLASALDQR